MQDRAPEIVSSGAVIYRDEGGTPVYLVLRYASGHWDYAKGHVETGESEEEAARREIEEETGITEIDFLPGFRHAIRYQYRWEGRMVLKEAVFRIARTSAARGSVRLSHEHLDHAWLPYDEARRRLSYDNAREVLADAHRRITAPRTT